MSNLWEKVKKNAYNALNPLIRLIAKTGITPNGISTIGLLITIFATLLLIKGAEDANRDDYRYIAWFGAIILFSGAFDMLDGQLARLTGRVTKFGALYDSVLDRYSEMIMFFGICYYLVSHDYFWSSIFAFFVMIGSIMVSYVRAKAESMGVECKVGLMQRPERILTIGFSAVLYGIITSSFGLFLIELEWLCGLNLENISIFTFPIFLLSILTNYTAIQRLNHCYKTM